LQVLQLIELRSFVLTYFLLLFRYIQAFRQDPRRYKIRVKIICGISFHGVFSIHLIRHIHAKLGIVMKYHSFGRTFTILFSFDILKSIFFRLLYFYSSNKISLIQ